MNQRASTWETEHRLQLLTDNLPAQIAYVDSKERYVFVNRQYEKIFGLNREQIIGKSIHDIFGPENYTKIAGHVRKALSGQRIRFDSMFVAPDDTQRWMEFSYVPDVDAQGLVIGFYDLTRDVTERKLAEDALRESEQRFRAVFDNHFQFTGILDPTGRVIMANQTALDFIGAKASEIIGKPFDQTPWWTFDKEVQKQIAEALSVAASGEFVHSETVHRAKDGSLRQIDFSIKPVFDNRGKVTYLIPEGRDISGVRQAQKQALEAIAFSSLMLVKYNLKSETYDYVSPAVYKMSGFSESEFKSMSRQQILKRTHPDDIEDYEAQTRELLARSLGSKRRQDTIQIRFKHRDGHYAWLHADRTVLVDPDGNPEALVGVYRDISKEKKAEEELAETQALLMAAVEQTPAGIFIADAPDGTIRLANSAALGIRGEADDMLTQIPIDQHPRRWKTFHPDGSVFQPEDLPLSQAVLYGKTIHNQEVIIERSDGVKRWVMANAAPVRDRKGNIVAGVVVFPDITDRKEFEAQLQQYEHLVAASHDLMSLVDHQYNVQAISDAFAKCFGKHRKEVIGLPLAEVVGYDFYHDVLQPRMDRCVREGGIHEQMWIDFPDGERRFIDMIMVPNLQKGPDGEALEGYVTSARDMTERRRLEDQLRQAYKMEAIGTLAGGIAHDFNNILSAVMGYSELVLNTLGAQDAMRPNIEKIHQAGQRATELVRQILTFSRQTEQEVKPLQLKLVVKEALKLLRASIPTSIHIESQIQSNASVMADPTQMHQIIMNLCANAAYAMKAAGGTLTVRLEDLDQSPGLECLPHEIKAGNYIKLSVTDTGEGMTPEVKERIFDPFFTTKPKNEGTGMGMSLIHGIIKSCNGFIEVCSEPGEGSQFYIYLPSIEQTTLHKQTEEQLPIPKGSERILYVDDEEAIVDIAELMLKTLGYQVTCMLSSVDALRRFKEDPSAFDAVITDLTMPGMTGDKLAVELLRVRPDTPIIIATGFSEKLTGTDIAALGIRKLIMKPILIRDIAEALRTVLDED